MKAALIQLPHFYGGSHARPPECYPLGLGYLSARLSQAGIAHEGVNLWAVQLPAPEALATVDFSAFDILGISAYSTQYKYLKEFSLGLKKKYPEKMIVCGGPGPTFSYEIILKHTGVDICVIGEGENTFVDLASSGKPPAEIPGIAYRSGDKVCVTAPREYIKDLDSIPFPNRKLFDFGAVMQAANAVRAGSTVPGAPKALRRSADIIAGRGCPYSCNYCSKTFSGCRFRSIGNIMAEIEAVKTQFDIDHLQFNDELVVLNKERTLEFCRQIKRFGLKWSCQGRIDRVDRETLEAMKDAGCEEIGYGVESVTQSILDRMNKRLKVEHVLPVIKMTREIGIKPIIQYMFGYPGENDDTIDATVRFFKEIDHHFVGFSTTPIPGTELYRSCLEKGIIRDEEDYLLRLDSGYNVSGMIINLTDFSDKDFVFKKRMLLLRIMHHHLKRKPLAYARFFLGIAFNKARSLVSRVIRA